jgi:hypothetical protein
MGGLFCGYCTAVGGRECATSYYYYYYAGRRYGLQHVTAIA